MKQFFDKKMFRNLCFILKKTLKEHHREIQACAKFILWFKIDTKEYAFCKSTFFFEKNANSCDSSETKFNEIFSNYHYFHNIITNPSNWFYQTFTKKKFPWTTNLQFLDLIFIRFPNALHWSLFWVTIWNRHQSGFL